MAAPASNQTATSARPAWGRRILFKIATIVPLGLALGFGYDWASTRFYGPDRVAGFHTGVIQGALMPAALPTLLMGNDRPIYAPNNEGRPYKIGFIFGINACGTLFFGWAFWRPRGR